MREKFTKDASRGCIVPPAVVMVDGDVRYTAAGIVTLPIPDFTMPFNVITLVRKVYMLHYMLAYFVLMLLSCI